MPAAARKAGGLLPAGVVRRLKKILPQSILQGEGVSLRD